MPSLAGNFWVHLMDFILVTTITFKKIVKQNDSSKSAEKNAYFNQFLNTKLKNVYIFF